MLKALPLLVVSALAAACAAAALADTPPPPADTTTTTSGSVIADGVVLGGVAVGGMTSDAAVQALEASFASPIVLRFKQATLQVDPALLGLQVPYDNAVAKALTEPPNTTLGLHGTVDSKLVAAFVAKLEQRFDRKPVGSTLTLRGGKPNVSTPVIGVTVRPKATATALTAAAENGTRTTIQLPVKLVAPATNPDTIGPVLVIRRGANLLTLYDGAKVVRQFHVATGQASYPTPLGRFQIVVMSKNPWWYPPPDPWAKGEKPTPPGPGNPLGTRWMGLSASGVGIHGTPDSTSIGYSLSHGCIRMLIPQAE
ncbi:MAG TPA: L,D-transpeptidase family protein, partial [Gaiellaceae bacterium]|nr:L,D-transpeptidase family protein [Gaiellaceae bacterium]